jgi:hypothetical protein
MTHLVNQILTLGLLYLHSIPYEWFLVVLKAYVWNRPYPEVSIMESYTIKEVVECCMDYINDGKRIGLPVPLHEGRIGIHPWSDPKFPKLFADFQFPSLFLVNKPSLAYALAPCCG